MDIRRGALNLCLEMTDPAAEHILVLDADYQVDPKILDLALARMSEAPFAFIQFPQAYRGIDPAALPVASMFERYFQHFASSANAEGAMLPTGTLTFFRQKALVAVGGWPESSLTEDAALGVRFWRAGYRGLYMPALVGRGLMPFTLASLRRQRQRWAVGNLEVLSGLLRRGDAACLLTAPGRSVLAQLTAWMDGRPLPGLVLVAGGALHLVAPLSDAAVALINVAAFLVISMTALQWLEWSLISGRLGHSMRDRFASFRLHESLSWASMSALRHVVLCNRLGFARTPRRMAFGNPLERSLLQRHAVMRSMP